MPLGLGPLCGVNKDELSKKKKKDKGKAVNHVAIIDDGELVSFGNNKRESKGKSTGPRDAVVLSDSEEEERKYSTLEEQPQNAGYLDERPDVVIMKEKFTQSTFTAVDHSKGEVKEDMSEETSEATLQRENEDRSRRRLLAQVRVKEEPLDSDEEPVRRSRRADVSGRGAQTQVRGRLKAKQEEERLKKEKNEITDAVKEKYSRWSKGVKQREEIQERIAQGLHEMDKPLARSKDDADLDVHLKNIEREEDPMLQYIRKKKAKKDTRPKYPTYQGTAPQNRFGILPGYRWDGVDRSNCFEKKLFNKQNERKAIATDAYKWSTEDM